MFSLFNVFVCLFNGYMQQKFSFLQDATSIRFRLMLILWVYYSPLIVVDFHYTNTDFNSFLFSFPSHLNFILLVPINTAISTGKMFTNIHYRSVWNMKLLQLSSGLSYQISILQWKLLHYLSYLFEPILTSLKVCISDCFIILFSCVYCLYILLWNIFK